MKKKVIIIIAIFCLILVGSGFLHGWNMLHFPYYESDEGTYVSQAWSLLETGELTPYTYWYDHPPLGWVFIALWAKVLGGDFFRFGTSVDTGRVLMLLVHLVSVSLVFSIIYRATKNALAAFLGGLLFSISPLAIYFQRRVLLDNIMTMWILASTAVLFVPTLKLRHYLLSGAFLAIAVLTKVTAIMFGPPLLLYVIFKKNEIPLAFRSVLWIAISGFITSMYVLYAFLRNELIPSATGEHVSLISSFVFQMSRGGSDGFFWDPTSDFHVAVLDWMNKDEIGVLVGAGIIVLGIINALWYKKIRFFVLAIILYFWFLVRGGVVINFYVLPLIPFVAIIGSILVFNYSAFFSKREGIRAMFIAVPIFVVLGYYGFHGPTKHFIRDETSQQKAAIVWIKEHLPNDSAIIIDSYALVDIRDPRNVNEKTFPNADWFYKVNRDPEIRDGKYHADWQNFDYIALTHEMLRQIEQDEEKIVKEAYRNSLPIAKWLGSEETFIDEQRFDTTNGDWAMVFKVNDWNHARLLDSWEAYKERYVVSRGDNYGQVVDLRTNVTTSEGQSYAMLRAVWMNDRRAFIGSWLWARNHLQHRLDDKLFSWQWKDGELADSANATDADEDIALALLFGYKLWNEEEYLDEAKVIIDDIWEHCVVKINGRYHFLPMHEESADKWNGYLFNPSYLSPATYRIFAMVDPKHEWDELADDSYEILNYIGELKENRTYLPADWYFLDKKFGTLYAADAYFEHNVDNFSFDAFRTLWRVSLDEQWFDSEDAREYLAKSSEFPSEFYKENGRLPMSLPLSGKVTDDRNSLSVDTGYAIVLQYGIDQNQANDFFNRFIEAKYNKERRAWNNKANYYDDNWAWFGAGAFHRDLPNIWNLNVLQGRNKTIK